MAQQRVLEYKANDSTFVFNRLSLDLLQDKSGVMCGYDFVPTNNLNFTFTSNVSGYSYVGIDGVPQKRSLLVTKQGVFVSEDNIATIPITPSTVARKDLIICTHTYVAINGGNPANYSVLTDIGEDLEEVINSLGVSEIPIGMLTLPADCNSLTDSGVSFLKIEMDKAVLTSLLQVYYTKTEVDALIEIARVNAVPKGTIIATDEVKDDSDILLFDNTGLGLTTGKWKGWALCNGANGTPNLRAKFVYGLDETTILGYDAIGNTGGDENVTLTPAQIPIAPHKHEYFNGVGINAGDYLQGTSTPTWKAVDYTPTAETELSNDTRDIEAHNNMPPYIILAYIKKIV
jgi:hypothetical protein